MENQKLPKTNIFVFAFILACAAVSYIIIPLDLPWSDRQRVLAQCENYLPAVAAGLWVAHAVLSKKYRLSSANTWFCLTITLLAGKIAASDANSISHFGEVWGFVLGPVVFLGCLFIYCRMTFVNGWVTFLTALLGIAAMADPIVRPIFSFMYVRLDALRTPIQTLSQYQYDHQYLKYQIPNGLSIVLVLIAVIQPLVDASRASAKHAREQRERREAEREAARVADRRKKLPKEIAAMQGYSLNVLPFVTYLQTITRSSAAFDRMVRDLRSHAETLPLLASEKNAEAEELGIADRVFVFSQKEPEVETARRTKKRAERRTKEAAARKTEEEARRKLEEAGKKKTEAEARAARIRPLLLPFGVSAFCISLFLAPSKLLFWANNYKLCFLCVGILIYTFVIIHNRNCDYPAGAMLPIVIACGLIAWGMVRPDSGLALILAPLLFIAILGFGAFKGWFVLFTLPLILPALVVLDLGSYEVGDIVYWWLIANSSVGLIIASIISAKDVPRNNERK